MRRMYLLFVVGIFPLTGCSMLIVSSGTDLSELANRTEVRSKLGEPVESGVEDQPYDEFRTRRKLGQPWYVLGIVLSNASTLGLAEFIFTPWITYEAAKRSINGQVIRVLYDDSGEVISITVNGQYWQSHSKSPQLSPTNEIVLPADVKGPIQRQ